MAHSCSTSPATSISILSSSPNLEVWRARKFKGQAWKRSSFPCVMRWHGWVRYGGTYTYIIIIMHFGPGSLDIFHTLSTFFHFSLFHYHLKEIMSKAQIAWLRCNYTGDRTYPWVPFVQLLLWPHLTSSYLLFAFVWKLHPPTGRWQEYLLGDWSKAHYSTM